MNTPIKRRILYALTGRSSDDEYIDSAKQRYAQITAAVGDVDFASDEEIIDAHIGSRHKHANLFKVKTRMLLTREFIRTQTQGAISSAKILDVGASSGILFRALKVAPANGVGVNVIEECVATLARDGYTSLLVDDEHLPFAADSFDYAFSFECLEHTYAPLTHLREMRRVVRKGIFLSVPYRVKTCIVEKKEGSSVAHQHIFEFSPKDFAIIAMHAGLRVVKQTTLTLERNSELHTVRYLYRRKQGWGEPSVFLAYMERNS